MFFFCHCFVSRSLKTLLNLRLSHLGAATTLRLSQFDGGLRQVAVAVRGGEMRHFVLQFVAVEAVGGGSVDVGDTVNHAGGRRGGVRGVGPAISVLLPEG